MQNRPNGIDNSDMETPEKRSKLLFQMTPIFAGVAYAAMTICSYDFPDLSTIEFNPIVAGPLTFSQFDYLFSSFTKPSYPSTPLSPILFLTANYDQKVFDEIAAKPEWLPDEFITYSTSELTKSKANIYMEFMRAHIDLLKSLSPENAKKKIDVFIKKMNTQFAALGDKPDTTQLLSLKDKMIKDIQEKYIQDDLTKSLIAFEKEAPFHRNNSPVKIYYLAKSTFHLFHHNNNPQQLTNTQSKQHNLAVVKHSK